MEHAGCIDDFLDEPLLDQIGWNGKFYADGSGEVFTPPGLQIPEVIFEKQSTRTHKNGDVRSWIVGVAEPLSGHSLAEFLMMIPFAGPMRSLSDRVENFGFELIGRSSCGKSSLLQLMASTSGGIGGGSDGNYALSLAGTSAGFESVMRFYSDGAMLCDESTQFGLDLSPRQRGLAYTRLLMDLGRGQERQRYLTTPRTHKMVIVITGNESYADIAGGTAAHVVLEAAAQRLITIPIGNREFGVLDHLPTTHDDAGEFLNERIAAAHRNHGTAMSAYIAGLVNERSDNESELLGKIAHHKSTFLAQVNILPNDGQARRIADAFASVYVAGLFAQHLDILPESFDCLGSTLATYDLHLSHNNPAIDALERIKVLATGEGVIDLDRQQLPRLTSDELATAAGFTRTRRGGQREFLIAPAKIRSIFPSWNRLRQAEPLKSLITTEARHHEIKRPVRENRKRDRMVCIKMEDPSIDAKLTFIKRRGGSA